MWPAARLSARIVCQASAPAMSATSVRPAALFARWWIAYPEALPFVRGRNLPQSLRLLPFLVG